MTVNEQHYTLKELSTKWHLSVGTIRRWCDEQGGVLVLNRPESMNKRGYRTVRIPQSTADAVYRCHFSPRTMLDGRHGNEPAISHREITAALEAPSTARPTPSFSAPCITIFSRHTRDCKYHRDGRFQDCDCPKSFGFTWLGSSRTLRSGTRSWKEAEEMKQKAVALVVRGECYDAWGAITQVRSEILLSVTEAALELGFPEEEFRQIIERKELPVVRFGKQTYVNRTELKARIRR